MSGKINPERRHYRHYRHYEYTRDEMTVAIIAIRRF